jgi:hypothetical protein
VTVQRAPGEGLSGVAAMGMDGGVGREWEGLVNRYRRVCGADGVLNQKEVQEVSESCKFVTARQIKIPDARDRSSSRSRPISSSFPRRGVSQTCCRTSWGRCSEVAARQRSVDDTIQDFAVMVDRDGEGHGSQHVANGCAVERQAIASRALLGFIHASLPSHLQPHSHLNNSLTANGDFDFLIQTTRLSPHSSTSDSETSDERGSMQEDLYARITKKTRRWCVVRCR